MKALSESNSGKPSMSSGTNPNYEAFRTLTERLLVVPVDEVKGKRRNPKNRQASKKS